MFFSPRTGQATTFFPGEIPGFPLRFNLIKKLAKNRDKKVSRLACGETKLGPN